MDYNKDQPATAPYGQGQQYAAAPYGQSQPYAAAAQPAPYYSPPAPPQAPYYSPPSDGLQKPSVNPYAAAAAQPYPAQTYPAQPVYGAQPYGAPAVAIDVPAGGKPAGQPGGYSASGYLRDMEKSVRMGFVRKVYSVLAMQLLVTFAIVLIFSFQKTVQTYVQNTPAMLWAALGVSLFSILVLACCVSVARTYPWNYIFLTLFTLAEAYLVGVIASTYQPQVVAYAMGATFGLTVLLTLFAWQTKIDFTACAGSLFVVLMAFIIFGIVAAIVRNNVVYLVYATLGVVIYGVFLVFDTQMIIGGTGKAASWTTDDYVFAALNVYIDVIQMFLFLLRIFGAANRN